MFKTSKLPVKKTAIFLAMALMAACQTETPVAKKKQQLIKYKNKVVEINLKIKQLEKELTTQEDTLNLSAIPVAVKPVEPHSFSHFVEISGTVIPEKEAFVSAEINGQIKKIFITEGQKVNQGDLLLKLNTSITESSIAEAMTRLELTQKLYKKQKKLWDQKIGSEIQYLQAKTNMESAQEHLKTLQAQLEMAFIKAPFDGVIDEIFAKEGELAVPGRQLVQLINLSKMKIYADVSEVYLNNIQKGDMVFVRFPDLNTNTLRLPVYRKENVINDKTRTFKIEIKLNNPSWEIKPNQFVLVRFEDYHADNALVVPSEVIKKDIQGYFLYILSKEKNQNIARKVYITPGIFYKNLTEVKKGLNPGDQVMVKGYNEVSNGEHVKIM
ncbi:MAG: efflux RND transporter periplasmic adaptor subunit [Bacteroidales bacterium]|nr:efflux RND transporter periplasmic adaptor subunit [Bacteroidales bacterium]